MRSWEASASGAGVKGGNCVASWGPFRPYDGGVYMAGVSACLTPLGRTRVSKDVMKLGYDRVIVRAVRL